MNMMLENKRGKFYGRMFGREREQKTEKTDKEFRRNNPKTSG